MRSILRAGWLLAVIASATPASAAITWNVAYQDVIANNNLGFDDPVTGATRQSTFGAVLSYIDSVLTTPVVTIDVNVNVSQMDGTGFLGQGGTLFFTAPNGFQNGLLYDHATTGIDPSPANPDANVTIDFGYTFNNGLGAPGPTENDLFSVLLHEVTHAMGFSALMTASGTSAITGTDPGVYSVYASFFERGDTTSVFAAGGDFTGVPGDLNGGANTLFFGGANAVAAFGSPVPLVTPTTFAPGTSLSHIDVPTAVMFDTLTTGTTRRAYTGVDAGILRDMGWAIAIPEPSSVLLVGVGIAVVGVVRFQRWKSPMIAA